MRKISLKHNFGSDLFSDKERKFIAQNIEVLTDKEYRNSLQLSETDNIELGTRKTLMSHSVVGYYCSICEEKKYYRYVGLMTSSIKDHVEKHLNEPKVCVECGEIFNYFNEENAEGILGYLCFKEARQEIKATFYLCCNCKGNLAREKAIELYPNYNSDFELSYADLHPLR